MIARALPATITNAVRAINKGVFFVTTSLLRAPSLNAQILSVVQNEPAMGGSGGAEPLRLTCDAFRFGLFGPANAWSYPSFPPPIQSELFDTDSESDPAQRQQMPGAFKPPAPKAPVRYTCVQGPRRGLAGVFAFVCREDASYPECLSGTNLAFIGRRCLRWVNRVV